MYEVVMETSSSPDNSGTQDGVRIALLGSVGNAEVELNREGEFIARGS